MPDIHAAYSFADALRPFRRRLQRASVLEVLPVVCTAAVAAADLVVLFRRPGAGQAAAILGAAALAAALLAVAVAILRPPSLARTAAAVDECYRLNDYAVTALQFAGETDAVSRLVVADARARLATVDPRALAAGMPRHAWGLASAAVVSAVATLLVAQPSVETRRISIETGRDRSAGAAAGRASSTPMRPGAELKLAPAPATSSAEATAREAQAPAAERAADPSAGSSAARVGGRAAGQPDAVPATGTDATPRTAAPGAQVTSTAGSDTLGAAPGSRGSSRRGGAAGSGGATAQAGRGEAGGVGAGSVVSEAAPSPGPQPAGAAIGDARYRRAVVRAEAAIAQQRVPAHLRSYVRDYFLSLRQAPTR